MIKIFAQTDKTFNSNGDVSLIPLKALCHKADNGDFYLDVEADLKYVDYFQSGNIIVAKLPQGEQPFRISNPTITGKKFSAKCHHVFYDSKNYCIADSYVDTKDCDFAIKHLNNAATPQSEFTVSSDVTSINSFRCVRKSLYEAIMTVVERWGGHLVRDGFDIKIKEDISHDNGVVVQYRKNLKEITRTENWDNVVTKILPVGKDGTLLNAINPSASIFISSTYQWDVPFCKTVSFSQDIDKDDFPTEYDYQVALVNDLRSQATEYVNKYCYPQINYTLKANLDRITDIGDIIEVKDERLGVDLMTTVLSFEYDCVAERYVSVEFGNFKRDLSNLMTNIEALINKTITERSNNG